MKCSAILTEGGQPIQWRSWTKVYNWDRSTFTMRVHHRLTNEHIFPDNAQKMRHHLAEEALNGDILYLMTVRKCLLMGMKNP